MDKTNLLPYSKSPKNSEFIIESKYYYKYLKNVLSPYMKKEISKNKYQKITNFLHPKPITHINTIQNMKQNAKYARHPAFLYFDINKYYPCVDHEILKYKILSVYISSRWWYTKNKTYKQLYNHTKNSRYFKKFLKFLDKYLSFTVVHWKWLLSSNSITMLLAEIYLWDLFIWIDTHTIRWNDDFVLLTRKIWETRNIYENYISSELQKLQLIPSPNKLQNWILYKDNFKYIWFEFSKWWILKIETKRIDEYLIKVKNIFFHKPNQNLKKKIKKLRKLQFWFYYYYRISSNKTTWKSLSSQTRDIIRQYLFLYKINWKNRFIISNNSLYKLGVVDFSRPGGKKMIWEDLGNH